MSKRKNLRVAVGDLEAEAFDKLIQSSRVYSRLPAEDRQSLRRALYPAAEVRRRESLYGSRVYRPTGGAIDPADHPDPPRDPIERWFRDSGIAYEVVEMPPRPDPSPREEARLVERLLGRLSLEYSQRSSAPLWKRAIPKLNARVREIQATRPVDLESPSGDVAALIQDYGLEAIVEAAGKVPIVNPNLRERLAVLGSQATEAFSRVVSGKRARIESQPVSVSADVMPAHELHRALTEAGRGTPAAPDRAAEVNEMLALVRDAVTDLEFEALRLRHVEGLAVKEIAVMQDVKPDTVSARLHSAKKKAKPALEKQGITSPW